jgi:hypothetical protein
MYRVLFDGFNDRAIAQSSRFRADRACGKVEAIAQMESLQSRSRVKSEQAKGVRKIQIYRWCCF